MLRIYLDNCCYNRPFDEQGQLDIYLEAKAVLEIQRRILAGRYELIWSYVLDYENLRNPFMEKREKIAVWRRAASYIVEGGTREIVTFAKELAAARIKNFDALHVACAVATECDCFITTDYRLLRALAEEKRIKVLNPVDFVELEG